MKLKIIYSISCLFKYDCYKMSSHLFLSIRSPESVEEFLSVVKEGKKVQCFNKESAWIHSYAFCFNRITFL